MRQEFQEMIMNPAEERYRRGQYDNPDIDGPWKAAQICRLLKQIPDIQSIKTYADIGCWQGGVFTNLVALMRKSGFQLERIVGYDISPIPESVKKAHPDLEFRQVDFLQDNRSFDLITLNDILEHISAPQKFLAKVGEKARYLGIHIPLDDRWSVLLADQYNYRIKQVGHLSFWNPASAFNLAAASGLLVLHSFLTPGFLAPSGRLTTPQKLALPVRFLIGAISPVLASVTVGGYSLAMLCRGKRT